MTKDKTAVDDYVDALMATRPPLTEDRKQRLRTLLNGRPAPAGARREPRADQHRRSA